MTIDRRSLLSAGLVAGAAPAVAQAGAQAGAPNDPLGVRGDFPILQNGRTFLNGAYVMPIPRQVVAAISGFAEAKAGLAKAA